METDVVLNLISQQAVPAKTRCGFVKSITSQGEQKLRIITGICVLKRSLINIKRSELVKIILGSSLDSSPNRFARLESLTTGTRTAKRSSSRMVFSQGNAVYNLVSFKKSRKFVPYIEYQIPVGHLFHTQTLN